MLLSKKLLIVLIIVSIVAFFLNETFSYKSRLEKTNNELYTNNKAIVDNILDLQSDSIRTLSVLLANNKQVRDGYTKNDPEIIKDYIKPFWDKAKTQKLIHEIHFFKPPAESFVNFSNFKSIGKDVSDARMDISWVTSTFKSSSHTMMCKTYAGIRATIPILDDDGSILGGLSLGKKIDWLPTTIKKTIDLDSFLVYDKNSTSSLVKKYYINFLKDKKIIGNYILADKTKDIPPSKIEKIDFSKKIQNLDIDKVNYSLNVFPILDFENKQLGYICILNDLTMYNNEFIDMIIKNLFLLFLTALLIYFLLKFKINETMKKIREIEDITNSLQSNDFKILDKFQDVEDIKNTDSVLGKLEFNIIETGKALKKQIEKQTKVFETIFNKSSDGILIIEDGKFTRCNTAVVKMLGYKNENDFLGIHPSKLSPKFQPDGKDSFSKANEMLEIAIKRGSCSFQWRHVKANADEFWVEVILTNLSTDDKNMIHVVWRDIQDKKEIELQLEKKMQEDKKLNWIKDGSNQLNKKLASLTSLDLIANNSITFLCKYLKSGVGALYINEVDTQSLKLLSSYALKRSEGNAIYKYGEGIVGEIAVSKKASLIELFTCPDMALDTPQEVHYPASTYTYPISHRGKLLAVISLAFLHHLSEEQKEFLDESSEIIAISIATALKNSEVRELLKTVQDNNQQLEENNAQIESQNLILKRSENELNKKALDLERSNRYKSEFLANMSHELRTPLNSIILLSEMLKDDIHKHLDKEEIKKATIINSSGQDLLKLIGDILDLSKIESGKMELIVDEFDSNLLSVGVHEQFQYQANNKNLKLIVIDEYKKIIRNDKDRIDQVIRNFMSNSLKFTKEGSITFKIEETKDKKIRLSVSDTGIGINKNKIEMITEAFQQADGSTSREYGGTGLGLSISKALAKMMQGEIIIESEEGKGSTFSAVLPNIYI